MNHIAFSNDRPPAEERVEAFGKAVDALRERIHAKVGAEDVAYIKRVDDWSRVLKWCGRVLIHGSFEPIGFLGGVLALGTYQLLQSFEIGHTSLHGSYDKFPEAKKYHSKVFYWDHPMDEGSFRFAHNVKHHGFTNVEGEDPDISTGYLRISPDQPHRLRHWVQLPLAFLVVGPNLASLLHFRYTGMQDIYSGKPTPERSVLLEDRSLRSVLDAHRKAFRKLVPYVLKEYVAFPALAGPFFPKVMLGNWLAGTFRDLWLSAAIFCTHQGEEMPVHPKGSPRPSTRGEFYVRQIEATRNTRVNRLTSLLIGGLDFHIEHHLFPKLPPNRLREIGSELEAICAQHGVRYRSESWGSALVGLVRHWSRTSLPWVRRKPARED